MAGMAQNNFFPIFRPENGPRLINVVDLYMSKDGRSTTDLRWVLLAFDLLFYINETLNDRLTVYLVVIM